MNKEINPSKIMRGMKFYSVEDLSEILGITNYAVRDNLRKSKIPGVKVGRRWYVSQKNLDSFLNTGNIFDKPKKIILDTIKEGLQERDEALRKELTEVFLKQLSENYIITKKS